MMMFSLLDLIFALFVLFFALSAMHAGFMREVLGKLAVIFGILGGVFISPLVSPNLLPFVKVGVLATILAFMLVFSAVFLIVKIVQVILVKTVRHGVIKKLDGALGFLLGFVEGTLLVCAFLVAIVAQPWINTGSLLENCAILSFLEPYLNPAVSFVSSRLIP